LQRNQLKQILNPKIYPERKHDYILELMKKFELSYALNEEEYLLPDLFSVDEPEFEFENQDSLHFILAKWRTAKRIRQ
jgi:internalin A